VVIYLNYQVQVRCYVQVLSCELCTMLHASLCSLHLSEIIEAYDYFDSFCFAALHRKFIYRRQYQMLNRAKLLIRVKSSYRPVQHLAAVLGSAMILTSDSELTVCYTSFMAISSGTLSSMPSQIRYSVQAFIMSVVQVQFRHNA